MKFRNHTGTREQRAFSNNNNTNAESNVKTILHQQLQHRKQFTENVIDPLNFLSRRFRK